MREPGNFYSHVSLWEMAMKSGSGKLKLQGADGRRISAKEFLLRLLTELELTPLVIEFDNLADVERLPSHHKDPFDRLLVVQAKHRNIPIISADPIFERYGVDRAW